jgi:hypothetical protein
MPYYPLSQIKPNLYTNGGEYVLSTTKENYIGYYYEVSNGKKYTGKTPQDGQNILLILPITIDDDPLQSLPSNPFIYYINYQIPNVVDKKYEDIISYEYWSLKTDRSIRIIPPQFKPLPTVKDYSLGVFQRFFCKKNNENIYFETDSDSHAKLSQRNSGIAFDLYSSLSTLWYLKGDKEKIYQANKGLIRLIEQNQKWHGFSQFFKEDYLKYYQSLDVSNLYTSGGEFKTQSGQDYVGFYHIHNGTIPMVGKIHTNNPHEVLIPIQKPIVQQKTQNNSSTISNISTYSTPTEGGGNYGGGGGSY